MELRPGTHQDNVATLVHQSGELNVVDDSGATPMALRVMPKCHMCTNHFPCQSALMLVDKATGKPYAHQHRGQQIEFEALYER